MKLLEVHLCYAEQACRWEKCILDKEVALLNTEVHSQPDGSISI